MKNLRKQLHSFKKDVNQYVVQCKIKLAQEVLSAVVMATPVDTSKALSNWIVSLRRGSSKITDAHFSGSYGSTFAASAGQTVALGDAVIKNVKIGETIFITNNVNYIELLNKGWSKQAPSGFIEQQFNNAVKRVKL